MTKELKRCTRCVMDTTDTLITFDSDGVCDHCRTFETSILPSWNFGKGKTEELRKITDKIKLDGHGKNYDCLLGLSGGVDSSYLCYLAHRLGLRPLIFHVDAGWNTKIAVNNIEKLVDKLNLDLYTEVINWEEMRDLQIAFFKSGVSHIDTPQDHAFFATMYRFAEQNNIRYILTGANYSTECIRNPIEWMYYQSDSAQLTDIHRRFGKIPLKTFPQTNILRHKILLPYYKKIKVIDLLNYIDYQKELAWQLLEESFGWARYEQKHFESAFTRFYEGYWLTKRFGFDVRKPQFSSLILTGQLSRDEALRRLMKSPLDKDTEKREVDFVKNKLGISTSQFDEFFHLPKKSYKDYKSQEYIYRLGAYAQKLIGLQKGGKR